MPALSPSSPEALRPYIVGLSHVRAPAQLREAVYIDEAAQSDFLALARDKGLDPALVIATCDRVEFLGLSGAPEEAILLAEDLLARRGKVERDVFARLSHRLVDEDAVRHLFRIACALDSLMVGESQILGQLKDAASRLPSAEGSASALDALLRQAFQIAKRVRHATRIGEGAVSVAAAAVKVAERLHGRAADMRGLTIGLGETGALLTDQFLRAGMKRMELTAQARRTEREAAKRGVPFVPFNHLQEALGHADVVVTAAGTGRALIETDMIERALTTRRRKPILFLDCGIPADIDPSVDSLEEAFLYTIEDVEKLAEKGQLDRKAEAKEAEAMVAAAVADWRRQRAELDGVPGLIALREHFDQLRQEVLDRHPNADAAEATRLLANRLLHEPSEALRAIANEGDAADLRDTIKVNRVLERLFGLAGTLPNNPTGDDE